MIENFLLLSMIIFVILIIASYYVTKNVIISTEKFGAAPEQKEKAIFKALHYFYIGYAINIILIAGALKLINNELFIALFTASLMALGIKISSEIKKNSKE
ncbi:MAG: hypothetical protein ACD_59C00131G0008 [uncultured bacterium]|nr:MAG: hypothetical protein ACD_59C00131G0008 [uncultured bacterium]